MPYHDWSVKLFKIGNRIFDFAPYRGMLGDTPLAKSLTRTLAFFLMSPTDME